MNGTDMIGASIVGGLAMAGQWKKYASKESGVLELRRLCCTDESPKNSESYFISKMLMLLRKHTDAELVISYADPTHGHSGVIYQASNFQRVGLTSPGKVIIHEGKVYHDHCIRAKYKGVLKPFAVKIKSALDAGLATTEKRVGKIIYSYRLKPIQPHET